MINNYGFCHNCASLKSPAESNKLILSSSVNSPVWITAEIGKRFDQITEGDFLMSRREKVACLGPERDSKPINFVYLDTY